MANPVKILSAIYIDVSSFGPVLRDEESELPDM
jgi:hypothetical protein